MSLVAKTLFSIYTYRFVSPLTKRGIGIFFDWAFPSSLNTVLSDMTWILGPASHIRSDTFQKYIDKPPTHFDKSPMYSTCTAIVQDVPDLFARTEDEGGGRFSARDSFSTVVDYKYCENVCYLL